ncbi:PREDICTED: EKC/KEOPS complex subunit Tprkb-like [Branchiostoma belcheri]|uniref:EKC/KEOPS complex subunit Tprkb-like n=1 Tax=Branchiostoma belcheri TaxID=7741 RepID=A0A6P4ZWJ1_BRABE|nr:PREDICTED: EKC/KEOPS complex subunit Tprkb-like [Branchiostoma belcheri]XP_019633997.1 PREDICTED: EKC/KEOPS complex subunit Tprkb-like [Branchiostoma belcheri]XP_019633998.1 PREDICTED: EKC/KEOPS complex subunit Tprkb-like [Branchiostoma belcheri]
MEVSTTLDLYPDTKVSMVLFSGVTNGSEVRRKIMDGTIEAAIINAQMICDPFQVLVAVNKAVHLDKLDKKKTKTVFGEILFNLSPGNNILAAYQKFGVQDAERQDVLVVLLNDLQGQQLQQVSNIIQGTHIPLESLKDIMDEQKIIKLFKISEAERKVGQLVDVVVCRMATKDAG